VPDAWLLGMNAARDDGRDAGAWRERYADYLPSACAAPAPGTAGRERGRGAT
jgi:hypothetical protein